MSGLRSILFTPSYHWASLRLQRHHRHWQQGYTYETDKLTSEINAISGDPDNEITQLIKLQ